MTEPPFSSVLVVMTTLRITKRRPRSAHKTAKPYDSSGFGLSAQPIAGRATGTNLNDHEQIAAARSVATENPERFEALIGRMKPFVSPGRTTAPPRPVAGAKTRHTTIANALKDFAADDKVAGLTTVRAFVALRLREAGLGKMTDDESAEYTG